MNEQPAQHDALDANLQLPPARLSRAQAQALDRYALEALG